MASLSGHPLEFRYDFANGDYSLDRDRVFNGPEEIIAICKILVGALIARLDLVGRVCNLLNSTELTENQSIEGRIKADLWYIPKEYSRELAPMLKTVAGIFKEYLLEGKNQRHWLYLYNRITKVPLLSRCLNIFINTSCCRLVTLWLKSKDWAGSPLS